MMSVLHPTTAGLRPLFWYKMKPFSMKRLENKVAVVYGDGAAGGAIAKAFAREGAMVFLIRPGRLQK
jgi:hypothetical protein